MDPIVLLIAGVPCALISGLAVYWAVSDHYRRLGYTPIPDHDKNQAEFDNEFAPLHLSKD